MKRNTSRLITILSIAIIGITLPSCRSSKKSESAFYDTKHEHFRINNDKNAKHSIGDSKTRKKIVKEANGWLGTPYSYGKAEKGVACDCSGMVMSVYLKVTGVKLPRNSAQQRDFCKKLKKKDVKIGDLCFFATGKDPDKVSHVGIMVDDTNFIHASTSKGVVVSDISQPYYVKTFKGFGRVPD